MFFSKIVRRSSMGGSLLKRILRMLSPLPQTRRVERFLVAFGAGIVAVFLRALLDPVLGHVAFYVTVYMAVAFSALVCGFGPAVLSALVGFLGILYWFVDPRNSLSLVSQAEIHGMIGFFLVSVALVALGDANRRKQLQLNETVAALTQEGHERERAERELRNAHDQLEQRVEQRTAELSETLTRLESEIEVRRQAEEELRQLSVRLMTLQDEERRRLARNLHDSTGQTLAALKMTIGAIQHLGIDRPDLLQLADDMNALADEAVRDVRTTSHLLHPPLLDEVGFVSAARWFVEGFAKRSNIQVRLEIAEPNERLSNNCELALFRVLQESLTNVHRHSGASAAEVTFTISDHELQLAVRDNGHGIDELRLQKLCETKGGVGVGVAGMRERIRELGGTLDISSDESGTTISVAVPNTKPAVSRVPAGVPA